MPRARTGPFPGEPVVTTLRTGARLVRIYDSAYYADGARFRYYGPVRAGRFDHHPEGPAASHPGYGVLYATPSLRCAVAEAFGDDRWVEPLPTQRLAVLRLRRAVPVVETGGMASVPLGQPDGALRSRDRALTQRIARDLYRCTDAQGIGYDGWFTGERCLALWERCAKAVELVDDRALTDPWVSDAVEVAADELLYSRP